MKFEFSTSAAVLFGAGTINDLPVRAAAFGQRVLLVTGSRSERASTCVSLLADAGFTTMVHTTAGEPTIDTVREGTAVGRAFGCDLIVGIGGGSALDAAKAIAALLGNGGDPLDYLEVFGRGLPLTRPSLPFIAVPTTAGTGTEVTRNAVLASPQHGAKASLRSPFLLPRIAIVDPDLIADLPKPVLASSGLDALSQLVEPFVCNRRNSITDALAREGMQRSARSLQRAFEHGLDPEEREDLAAASLLGGMCLANAGLGAVHGFAAPIGGMFRAPHGAVCAVLLPHVIHVNCRALRERSPDALAIARYREVARILTGRADARVEDAVAWVQRLCQALAIPPLASHGIRAADVPAIVEKAKVASSMKANPIVLRDDELTEIVTRAL